MLSEYLFPAQYVRTEHIGTERDKDTERRTEGHTERHREREAAHIGWGRYAAFEEARIAFGWNAGWQVNLCRRARVSRVTEDL